MNAFGDDVRSRLGEYAGLPLTDASFETYLSSALLDVELADSDGDEHDNLSEIDAGTRPGDASSFPQPVTCPSEAEVAELDYLICRYDRRFAYRKVGIDFCGVPPRADELDAFVSLSLAEQDAALLAKLDECLDSQFWQGVNGQLWSLAHDKIKPLSSFFSEETNFFWDYAFFTYTQLDGHDVRDLLVGQFIVGLEIEEIQNEWGEEATIAHYVPLPEGYGQFMQPERRAGLLTHSWMLFYNTMFTALPRATAAQAYRSYLGLDIAASEGLDWPVSGEPVDYDASGVTAPECAVCHSTLDPLSYPFATYNGLQMDDQLGVFMYDPDRIEKYFVEQYPAMADMPEAGYLFGEPVADLLEWAQVAANSDQFFIATTTDYWTLLMGEPPRPDQAASFAEFTALWQELHGHRSVEDMLRSFVLTEAYGAP